MLFTETKLKRDLAEGEILDDYGMYMTYGEAVNVEEMRENRYLPEDLVEGYRLPRAIKLDAVITYAVTRLPAPEQTATTPRKEIKVLFVNCTFAICAL